MERWQQNRREYRNRPIIANREKLPMTTAYADFIINYQNDLQLAGPGSSGKSPLALCLRRTIQLPENDTISETDSSITITWHDHQGNPITAETYAINPKTAYFPAPVPGAWHQRRQAPV